MNPVSHQTEVLSIMRLAPVIPVLTVRDAEDGVAQARALVAGGLLAIEVTLRTAGALAAIKAIRNSVPGAMVGAGTILTPEQIAEACAAGARFLVSPGASPRLAQAAAAAPVPFLPGVATASEAMALMELGFHALKLFPGRSGRRREIARLARRPAARPALLPDRRHRSRQGAEPISRCPTCSASAAPGCCPRRRWRRATMAKWSVWRARRRRCAVA